MEAVIHLLPQKQSCSMFVVRNVGSIQIANREGLIPRLEEIDYALPKLANPSEKIAFAQEIFAVDP